MDESPKSEPQPLKRSKRWFRWLDRRTGVDALLRASLDEPIPGGARLAYVFGSGLLFIFISQVITGLCLALYYVPSAESAHTSVAYITKQVTAGAFLRSLHSYGASAMIVVLLLHFLQTFLYGSYKGRRELLWISGAALSLLVLAMGFTGYLLPWDQNSYYATAVGTNLVGQVPLVGGWLTRMIRGGDTIGTLTISRFYFAHVFLIPGMIFLLIGIHIALFRKAGAAGPMRADPIAPQLPTETFYPRQVLMDMGLALLLMAALGLLAYFRPVGLGPIANPASTQFLPRPEWYYLPMFEWLKFWEGPEVVFAVVAVSGLLALVFFLLPFLDRSLERRPWRRPIPLLGVSIVMAGMIFLGIKSQVDDARDPSIAAQLAIQTKQERAYDQAPFHAYLVTPNGATRAGGLPLNPLAAHGRKIFVSHGCTACHGVNGAGGAAVALAGISRKFSATALEALLHHPTAQMKHGGMPAVTLAAGDMTALLKYLNSLSTGSVAGKIKGHLPTPAAPTTSGKPATGQAGNGRKSPHHSIDTNETTANQAGRKIFQTQGCAACHGAAGAGTAQVPPMASLVAKLTQQQISHLLQYPSVKMRAGSMPTVTVNQAQKLQLAAYLSSLASGTQKRPGKQSERLTEKPGAHQGSAVPPSASMPTNLLLSPLALRGEKVFQHYACESCHGIGGISGTVAAMGLAGTASKLSTASLTKLLRHHNASMQNGGMPLTNMDARDLQAVVAYIRTLRGPQKTSKLPQHP